VPFQSAARPTPATSTDTTDSVVFSTNISRSHDVSRVSGTYTFTDISDDTSDSTIDVELTSVIVTVQAVVREMVRTGSGRIVLVGSDSGKVGTIGECVSAACRAGIIALAKSVAREYARHKILANVVSPAPQTRNSGTPSSPATTSPQESGAP
jgi:NAD(P)-dependent dehydrogenase (short-subunit alcohol dehydrogenase family)